MSTSMQCLASYYFNSERIIEVQFKTDNVCPRCGCALPDQVPHAFFTENNSWAYIYLFFTCHKCRQSFVFEYTLRGCSPISGQVDVRNYIPKIYPNRQSHTEFPPSIEQLSERFVEIYHQAETAEINGCTEICGMGYRKAVEFLVKDYLCLSDPGEKDKIATENLRVAIRRLNDERVQTLADRAAWIGNEETHYVRKQEDYNTADLKRFILAMVSYLQSELTLAEASSIDTTR